MEKQQPEQEKKTPRQTAEELVAKGLVPLLSLHPLIATAAVGVHTISHLVIAGLVAGIVYDFIGLAVLRRSWINLDLIWCFSLPGAAVILFFAPLA